MPRHRFVHPEDAAEQLARAVACHERLFGRRPVGLWPSEGSVSDAMVPLVAAAGFTWMATDELILARTLGATFSRDAAGPSRAARAALYAPIGLARGGAHDRVRVPRSRAVGPDRLHLRRAGPPRRRPTISWRGSPRPDAGTRARTGGEEALIPIILDGENAWEHFEGGGRPFLRALYRTAVDAPRPAHGDDGRGVRGTRAAS